MTTLSQFPPTFEVTAADDDMEISSEMGRYDQDVDIDLDAPSQHLEDHDGDFMLDDVRSENGNTAALQDQEMIQDVDYNLSQPHDENLADANFHHLGSAATIDESTTFGSELQHHEDASDLVDFGASETQVAPEDNSTQLHNSEAAGTDNDLVGEDYLDQRGSSTELPSEEQVTDQVTVNQPTDAFQEHNDDSQAPLVGQDNEAASQVLSQQGESNDGNTNAAIVQQIDESITHPPETSVAEESEEHTSDGALSHPVIVNYYDNQLSLFPPTRSDEAGEYFLEDSSLASQSIAELLQACREVLGETITDEEELRMVSDELALEIGEESAHAHSTSLAEILEVYLELHRLDGTETPDPFEITLDRKERFTAALSRLRAAIADGRGMSQVWLQVDDEDEEGAKEEARETAQNDGDFEESDTLPGKGEEGNDSTQDGTQNSQIPQSTADAGTDSLEKSEGTRGTDADVKKNEQEDDGSSQPNAEDNYGSLQDEEAHDEEHGEDVIEEGEVGQDTIDLSTNQEHGVSGHGGQEQHDGTGSSGSSTIVGEVSGQPDEGTSTDDPNSKQDTAAIENPATARAEEHSTEEPHDYDGFEFGQAHDQSHFEERSYETAGDEITTADHAQDLHWEGQFPAATELEQQVGGGEAHEQDDEQQDGTWNDFLEVGGEDEEEWAENDPTLNDATNLDASTETLVNIPDQQQQADADDDEVDEIDEITFDEGDVEDGFGADGADDHYAEQQTTAHQPSQSPPGKRSWTEHLEDDADEEGSDSDAKRLRSA